MSKRTAIRFLTWGLAAIAVIAVTLAFGWLQTRNMESEADQASQNVSDIGGPFTAHDQHGRVITQQDLLGKPTLMFFGYTYCPDVCPTTLSDISSWLAKLGPDADKLNVAFITVDPMRDTPAHMSEYLSSFDRRIIGIIPNEAELKHIAQIYHVYYAKVGKGDNYTMNHSAGIYLLDSRGRLASIIDYQEDRISAFEKIQMLLQP